MPKRDSATMKEEASTEELYGELGHAFNFTRGDLEANRAGFVSYRQKKWLQTSFLVFIITIVILVFIFAFATFVFKNMFDRTIEEAWWSFSIWLCCTSSMSIFTLYYLIGFVQDMQQTHPQKLVGQITLRMRHGKGINYYLTCGEKEFDIVEKQYKFPWKNFPYNVYYLPHRKIILSIEEATSE